MLSSGPGLPGVQKPTPSYGGCRHRSSTGQKSLLLVPRLLETVCPVGWEDGIEKGERVRQITGLGVRLLAMGTEMNELLLSVLK